MVSIFFNKGHFKEILHLIAFEPEDVKMPLITFFLTGAPLGVQRCLPPLGGLVCDCPAWSLLSPLF